MRSISNLLGLKHQYLFDRGQLFTLLVCVVSTLFVSAIGVSLIFLRPRYTIVLIGGIALPILAFAEIEIVLLSLLAFTPFIFMLPQEFMILPGLNIYNIITLLIMLSWFLRAIIRREKLFVKTSLNKPVVIFMIVIILSTIRSITVLDNSDFLDAVLDMKRWILTIFLFFLTTNNVRKPKYTRIFIYLMTAVYLYISVVTIRDCMAMDARGVHWDEARISGVLDGPNRLGGFLAAYGFFPIALLMVSDSLLERLCLLPIAGVGLRAILFTYSRGSLLAFVGGFIFCALMKDKKMLILAIIPLLLAPMWIPKDTMTRLESTFQSSSDADTKIDGSSSARLQMWKEALRQLPRHAIFGTGYTTFPVVISHQIEGLRRQWTAHNIYIQIVTEMGLVGLIVFVWLLIALSKASWQTYKASEDRYVRALGLGFLSCLVTTMAVNMTITSFSDMVTSTPFWIMAGVLARAKLALSESQLKLSDSDSS